MSLPAPNLDDRTFQDLVDDAKRFVQQRCPTWSDHNVSDPGVTLIETFAWMTDVLLYRLNRVPDRMYIKFLELIGVTLFPPTAAEVKVTFRLSSAQDSVVTVPQGAVVSTSRTTTEPPVAFTTTDALEIVPARSVRVASMIQPEALRDHTPGMGMGLAFECFDSTPKVDDALYIGFDQVAPRNTALFRFVCEVGGHGIDPTDPPLAWEAWDGYRWVACGLLRDGTGGLNLTGDVEIQLPDTHAETVVGGVNAPWVRCRVTEPREGQRTYRSSPKIVTATGAIIGGTCEAVHGEQIDHEVVGVSEGVAGQVFWVEHVPIALTATPPVLEVRRQPGTETEQGPSAVADGAAAPDAASDDWEEWVLVPNFADTDPDERNFTLDPRTGELRLGPTIRLADGSVHHYGAIPPKGATLRLRSYRTGGGAQGNVAAGAINLLRSSIPYIASVTNFRPAVGGVDAESVPEARERGPLMLRTRNRAVTAEDYEILAREAAPETARVKCVVGEDGPDAGVVQILVIPAAPQADGRIEFRDLVPDNETGERIRTYLDERRVVGTRVRVEPPSYVGVKVEASLRARPNADPRRLEQLALRALYEYFNPLSGGPDGRGWPFARPVQLGEVFGVLQGVRGLDFVENAVVMRANPITGVTADPQERIDLGPTNLVFSFEHAVEVV